MIGIAVGANDVSRIDFQQQKNMKKEEDIKHDFELKER
jgi:hypothetical protein